MDRSCILTLIAVSYAEDGIGQQVPTETARDVFGNVSSVSASEWFDGGQAGLNPEWRITMFAPDYHGESIVEYGGVRYGVYRTYRGRNDAIELYLTRKSGVTNGEEHSVE